MKRKYFGTNGIRGEIGDLFTPTFISKMSSAIAAFMNSKGTMVIGSDGRTSSLSVKNGVISSFLASGIEVIDIGMVPTPLAQFAVTHLKADCGIAITASHNPPHFNGIKVIDDDGIEINLEKQKNIEDIYEKDEFNFVSWEKNTKVTEIDLTSEYIDQIISFVDVDRIKKKKLTAVVDGGNAVGGLITPFLLKQLGVKVYSVNCQIDGRFPGRGVEPSPENLETMSQAALFTQADFSVAHDGDADRAIFSDEKGAIYFGDKTIALFQKWILNDESNKKFVTPVSSSNIVVDIARELGGEIIWTPVGCIFVSRKMVEINSVLGGEENGGLFYAPHQSVRDGPMATALMADIISKTGMKLSNLVDDLPQYYQRKHKIDCPEQLKDIVMNYVKNNVQNT
ncbi:MAG: phosphoglucosamine mutase, partial [Candidatus Heimdallarchaeaceae archaeon]